jgi:hypothetical protein
MEAYRLVLSLDGHGVIIEAIQQILTHYLVFFSCIFVEDAIVAGTIIAASHARFPLKASNKLFDGHS